MSPPKTIPLAETVELMDPASLILEEKTVELTPASMRSVLPGRIAVVGNYQHSSRSCSKTILDFVSTRVCSFVYSVTICWQKRTTSHSLILADYWEKIPMVLPLAYVTPVQVTGVTGSRSDYTAVLKYIGVGFGLTAPVGDC
jgi:hypothetical protein